ncbi:hypothetical protein ACRAWF_09065 [Streptomyces sp. L7]
MSFISMGLAHRLRLRFDLSLGQSDFGVNRRRPADESVDRKTSCGISEEGAPGSWTDAPSSESDASEVRRAISVFPRGIIIVAYSPLFVHQPAALWKHHLQADGLHDGLQRPCMAASIVLSPTDQLTSAGHHVVRGVFDELLPSRTFLEAVYYDDSTLQFQSTSFSN